MLRSALMKIKTGLQPARDFGKWISYFIKNEIFSRFHFTVSYYVRQSIF